MRVITAAQMKAAEQSAFIRGINETRLMENAGSACARIIREQILADWADIKTITVLCGSGNNGGDGFVIARKLSADGYKIQTVQVKGPPHSEASVQMLNLLERLDTKILQFHAGDARLMKVIEQSDMIIDCLFGTGFQGAARPDDAELFRFINQSKAFVVSIDVPSAINCDSAVLPDDCVKAHCTIAIAALKPAHVLPPVKTNCGRVIIAEIGLSESDFITAAPECDSSLCADEVKAFFPVQKTISHKGDYGRVLSVCGSVNMPGAAFFAAQAAVSSGAGLVQAAFPEAAYPAVAAKLAEPVLLPLDTSQCGMIRTTSLPVLLQQVRKADALLIGCGLGISTDTVEVVRNLLACCECPAVVDADALNIIARYPDMIEPMLNAYIFTPHPGEAARLLDTSVEAVESDRFAAARAISQRFGCVCLLKGAGTLISVPGSKSVCINTTGNPGLAKGGSGDVLAGMVASFLAQGLGLFESAASAAYIHGLTGDKVSEKYSVRGNSPSACLRELPFVLSAFERL